MMIMLITIRIRCWSKARLTDGCWSPTKISLFFTTRTDGFVEVGGKYENIREKFFSSNWGERKANNIIEDGIFFAQIFFSSDLGLPTQPETPNPYNQGMWEMTLAKSMWLREPDFFLKRSFLWIRRFSSRLPTTPSTVWKLTRQELWYALVLQTGSSCEIILEVSVLILVLVFFFSPGRRLWSSWTTAWPVAANSTGRTQMICSTGNVAKHLILYHF